MSNYNRNNNNNGGWKGAPFNNAPAYQPNYNQPQPRKKHSGANLTKYTPKEGPNAGTEMYLTTGWMYRKNQGLTSFKCNTTKKSKLSEKGWIGSIMCEVITNNQKSLYWGTMEKKSGKVVINELAIVINPKAKNGGYAGSFINKN
jgi:hypothetical protein